MRAFKKTIGAFMLTQCHVFILLDIMSARYLLIQIQHESNVNVSGMNKLFNKQLVKSNIFKFIYLI